MTPAPSASEQPARGYPSLALAATALLVVGVALSACSSSNRPKPTPTHRSDRTTVVFSPEHALSTAELDQAAEVIRRRVADLKLAGTQVTVGADTITVSAAGNVADQLSAVGSQAALSFRPVLASAPSGVTLVAPSASAAGSPSAVVPSASPSPADSAASPGLPGVSGAFTSGTVPADLQARFATLDCSDSQQRLDYQSAPRGNAVACSSAELQGVWDKYALGPVVVEGADVSKAEAGNDTQQGAGWQIDLTFSAKGAKAFADTTGNLAAKTSPQNEFAIVLDGSVLSSPYVAQAITGGHAVISGSFTEAQAETLAAELSAGSLPARFRASDVTHTSP